MNERVVVIGGSAGCITSISEILRSLPADFPSPICVVVHIPGGTQSYLNEIFSRAGPLPAITATDGSILQKGYVYVAPPDHHLIVEKPLVKLIKGAKENHHRPAIDPLFRSAAVGFGKGTVAVLLSGFLDDGSSGLLSVKRAGGRVIVQDPRDTPYPDMPKNALNYVDADAVLNVDRIASKIMEFLAIKNQSTAPHLEVAKEIDMVDINNGDNVENMRGELSTFSCPDCGGALWELEEGKMVRYRCHEGHAYSSLSLVTGQAEAIESALWVALRALDDKAKLAHRLAERAHRDGNTTASHRFEAQKQAAYADADLIRRVLNDTTVAKA